MLDQYNLDNLIKKLKITPLNIVREKVELEILNIIIQNEFIKKFIFYGGTALRLVFGLPGFFEDLDFIMIKKIHRKEFKDVLPNLTKKTKRNFFKKF